MTPKPPPPVQTVVDPGARRWAFGILALELLALILWLVLR